MSKIFGTLAAVLLAASAFIAFKNKEAKAVEIDTYKISLKKEVSTTKELKFQNNRLNVATEDKRLTLEAAEKVEAERVVAEAALESAIADIAVLESTFKAKENELAEADDALKELPDPKQLVPKIKRMRAELTATTNSIATEESRLANSEELDKNGKARIKRTRKVIELQSTGRSFPTLKTRISSIYRNWGFVILAAGDLQGVVPGSTLNVMRGGEVVAKLKVTAVEAGRASADIILDSVAFDVTLRTGDTVVAEIEEKTPDTVAK